MQVLNFDTSHKQNVPLIMIIILQYGMFSILVQTQFAIKHVSTFQLFKYKHCLLYKV